MYKFKAEINYTNFFRIDRNLIFNKDWANLPLASKAIYPTICVHCDKKGVAFPSQETVATMSGCTSKTVRAGIKGLLGFPGFRIEIHVTRRGNRACKYYIQPASSERGESVWFYRAFIDGGNWSQLRTGSKAVYIALLAFTFFDFAIYCDLTDGEANEVSEEEFYQDYFLGREFDLAEPTEDVLAEYSGVCIITAKQALMDLVECEFLEWSDEYNLWKVFRVPPYTYKVEYLNGHTI